MAALLVVAELVVAEPEVAGVGDGLLRRAPAGAERGQRHERLVGRARRIGAAQRAVEQRLVGRLVERLPVLVVDAVDEQVGVEVGLADEGQHLAVPRIDGHQRAAALAEHLLDQRLQLDVDRHRHRAARPGRAAAQAAHGAAVGAGLHLLEAGGAVQFGLVALLDAELADVVGAAVVGGVLRIVDGGLLALVDAADVADQVARRVAERIVAEQPRLHLDAREAEALRGEAGDLLLGQLGADRQRVEALAFLQQPPEAPAVARLHVDQLRQRVDGGVEVDRFRRRDLQRVGRIVVGQHDAVAVDDQPAVGDDRHHRDAVVLGLRRQLVVLHHLQMPQPRAEQREAQQHEGAGGGQPQPEAAEFALQVLQFGHVARIGQRSIGRGTTAAGSRPGRARGAAARAAAS